MVFQLFCVILHLNLNKISIKILTQLRTTLLPRGTSLKLETGQKLSIIEHSGLLAKRSAAYRKAAWQLKVIHPAWNARGRERGRHTHRTRERERESRDGERRERAGLRHDYDCWNAARGREREGEGAPFSSNHSFTQLYALSLSPSLSCRSP